MSASSKPRFIHCLIFCLALVFFARPAHAAEAVTETTPSGTRVSAAYTTLHAEHDDGAETRLRGEYRLSPNHLSLLEARSLTRTYGDGTRITDQGATLGLISKLPRNVYIENDIFVAPGAVILPVYTLTSAPFISLPGNFDLGAIAAFSHYRDQDVFTLSPTLLKTIEPNWLLGARANITRTYHDLLAFQAFAQRNFSGYVNLRGTVASGQAIEQAGIEAAFQSVGLDLRVHVTRGWFLNVGYGAYSSTIRKEQSLGLAIEWVAR